MPESADESAPKTRQVPAGLPENDHTASPAPRAADDVPAGESAPGHPIQVEQAEGSTIGVGKGEDQTPVRTLSLTLISLYVLTALAAVSWAR